MIDFIANTIELALTAAPWVLFGLLIAGLIRAWLPAKVIGRHLAGDGFRPVTWAALIGAPLPLCSCGVLPAAFALRRAGISKGATASFLVSTPETGVDSIAISYALLGPFLAIVRPVAAVLSAILTGLLVGRVEREPLRASRSVATAKPLSDGHDDGRNPHHPCCHNGHGDGHGLQRAGTSWERTLKGFRYAVTDLIDDLALWLLIGLLLAGAIVTLIPPGTLAVWGSGLFAMLLILLVSVPMYVCATATTPVAHAMLHTGVSPGTVLVFLLAGPATNIASLMLIRRELGKKTLTAYLSGVCGSSLLLGLFIDAIWGYLGFNVLAGHVHNHDHSHIVPLWISVSSLMFLMVVAIKPARRCLGLKIKGQAYP